MQKNKNMTHEFDGKKYEKASEHQKEWGNKLISELNLKGNEDILDLGCGDGKLTENLSKLVPNGFVLGIDASKGMVNVAKEKEKNNLKFQLFDINKINKINRKFDVIFSNATLHWIKDHSRLWENLKIILKPEGIIRFNFAADGNCSYFFKVIRITMTMNEYSPCFKDFEWPWFMPQIEEYKKLVNTLNFSEIKVWEENADRYFTNKEEMIKWINQPSIVPFLKYIPEEKKEGFRQLVITQMIKETLNDDGQCFETFRRINVFAKNKNA